MENSNNTNELLFKHEVIVLLSFDLGLEPDLEDLQEFLKKKGYIYDVRPQELYVDYALWKQNRPLHIILNPITVVAPNDGIQFNIQMDMRIYPSGACSFRYRAKSKNSFETTDVIIQITRALCFSENRTKLLTNSTETLQQFTNQIILDIRGHLENTNHCYNDEFSRFEVAHGYRMRYPIICVQDVKPRAEKQQLLESPYARQQIAGLLSWDENWRNFPSDYVEYLVGKPLPTKFKDGLVLVKFPATLLCLPDVQERTLDLYSIVIEHCRIESLFYRIYSKVLNHVSSKVVDKLDEISSVSRDKISRELLVSLTDMIWRLNRIKIEYTNSLTKVNRTREMIPLHRLLFVYDRLYEETKVENERTAVTEEISFLDSSIKDALNLLSSEWNQRCELESRKWTTRVEIFATILAVFTLGEILSNISAMYFLDLSSWPFLGRLWPAVIPWIFSGALACASYKIIKRKDGKTTNTPSSWMYFFTEYHLIFKNICCWVYKRTKKPLKTTDTETK